MLNDGRLSVGGRGEWVEVRSESEKDGRGLDRHVPYFGFGCARARPVGHSGLMVFGLIGACAGIAWAGTWAIFGHSEMCPAGGLRLEAGGGWGTRLETACTFVLSTIPTIHPWGQTKEFCPLRNENESEDIVR